MRCRDSYPIFLPCHKNADQSVLPPAWPNERTTVRRTNPMKRTFVLILAALAAAALFAVLVHAVLVAAQVAEPAATTVDGLTPRRLWATTAAALALVGVVSGGLALVRPARLPGHHPFRCRLQTAWNRRGPGSGADRRGQRRAESGRRHRWSRHRQRRRRCRRGVGAGADRHGRWWPGPGPLPRSRRSG